MGWYFNLDIIHVSLTTLSLGTIFWFNHQTKNKICYWMINVSHLVRFSWYILFLWKYSDNTVVCCVLNTCGKPQYSDCAYILTSGYFSIFFSFRSIISYKNLYLKFDVYWIKCVDQYCSMSGAIDSKPCWLIPTNPSGLFLLKTHERVSC